MGARFAEQEFRWLGRRRLLNDGRLASSQRAHTDVDANLSGQSDRRATERNTCGASRGLGGELRSPAFILLHVITHAFHHKGQVVAMLRIHGYSAPDTD